MAKALQRFTAMASAVVITLTTTLCFAGPGDLIRKKVKDIGEAGKLVDEGTDWMVHWKQFYAQIGWRDFTIPEYWKHALCVALVMAIVTLWCVRKWERKAIAVLFWGYCAGVATGLFYEFLRLAPSASANSGAKSILVLAGILFAGLLVWHAIKFFPNLMEARAVQQLPYFLRHGELPDVTSEELTEEEEEEEEEGGSVSQPQGTPPAPRPAPTPQPARPPVAPAPPRVVVCPFCHKKTEAKRAQCGHCLKLLPKTQMGRKEQVVVVVNTSVVTCPACHKKTEAKRAQCGHCLAPLKQETCEEATAFKLDIWEFPF